MKKQKARINIFYSRFILFELKIFGEIVSIYHKTLKVWPANISSYSTTESVGLLTVVSYWYSVLYINLSNIP